MVKTFFHYIRHYFTPHHSNNHRPKLLHASSLAAIAVFILFVQLSFNVVSRVRPDILGFATNITIQNLLQDTNEKRAQNDRAPVKLNDALSKAAERKALDMFAKNYWAHTSPTELRHGFLF